MLQPIIIIIIQLCLHVKRKFKVKNTHNSLVNAMKSFPLILGVNYVKPNGVWKFFVSSTGIMH